MKTYRFDDVIDEFFGFVDFLFCVCHDQTMEILLLIGSVRSITSALSFFYGSFSANGDFGSRFRLHFLQCMSTRADE